MKTKTTSMVSIGAIFCMLFGTSKAFAQKFDASLVAPKAAQQAADLPEEGQLFYRAPRPQMAAVPTQQYYQATASKAGFNQTGPAAPYPYPAQGQPVYQSYQQGAQPSGYQAPGAYLIPTTSPQTNSGTQVASAGQYSPVQTAQNGYVVPQSGTASGAYNQGANWSQCQQSPNSFNQTTSYAQTRNGYTQPETAMSMYDRQEKALEEADRMNRHDEDSFTPSSPPVAQPQTSKGPSFMGQLARQTAMMCLPLGLGALIGGAMAGSGTATTTGLGSSMPMRMPFGASPAGGFSRLMNGMR